MSRRIFLLVAFIASTSGVISVKAAPPNRPNDTPVGFQREMEPRESTLPPFPPELPFHVQTRTGVLSLIEGTEAIRDPRRSVKFLAIWQETVDGSLYVYSHFIATRADMGAMVGALVVDRDVNISDLDDGSPLIRGIPLDVPVRGEWQAATRSGLRALLGYEADTRETDIEQLNCNPEMCAPVLTAPIPSDDDRRPLPIPIAGQPNLRDFGSESLVDDVILAACCGRGGGGGGPGGCATCNGYDPCCEGECGLCCGNAIEWCTGVTCCGDGCCAATSPNCCGTWLGKGGFIWGVLLRGRMLRRIALLQSG